MQTFTKQKNNGFVILFAILVSSIILLISMGMFNIIQKELVLSSYARESQRAFYAADSALECALYADIYGIGEVNPSTPFSVTPQGSEQHTFNCGGASVTSFFLEDSGGTPGTSDGNPGYDFPYVFRYFNNYNSEDISCAYVLVEKNRKGTDLSQIEVRITAIGFNVCVQGNIDGNIDTPDFDDPTLLERRLSIVYTQ